MNQKTNSTPETVAPTYPGSNLASPSVSSTSISLPASISSKDALGDRVKAFEQIYAGQKLDENNPLLVRLDGKAFHTFTKGLARPFDERLSRLMIETMNYLVETTDARLGYTQSDEITLAYFKLNPTQQPYYNGKVQKLSSVLASMATAYFNKNLEKFIPEKKDSLPLFDCRVWSVPTLSDAAEVFLWRKNDAIKNAITMAASAHYSHKELMNKNSGDKIQMMLDKGVDFFAHPEFFRFGIYAKRTHKFEPMPENMEHLKGNSSKDSVLRSSIENFHMPDLSVNHESLDKTVFKSVFENHDVVMAHKEEVRQRKYNGAKT